MTKIIGKIITETKKFIYKTKKYFKEKSQILKTQNKKALVQAVLIKGVQVSLICVKGNYLIIILREIAIKILKNKKFHQKIFGWFHARSRLIKTLLFTGLIFASIGTITIILKVPKTNIKSGKYISSIIKYPLKSLDLVTGTFYEHPFYPQLIRLQLTKKYPLHYTQVKDFNLISIKLLIQNIEHLCNENKGKKTSFSDYIIGVKWFEYIEKIKKEENM